MNLLLLIVLLSATTYFTRILMIALLGRAQLGPRIRKMLQLTVPAVFMAIVIPNVITLNGQWALALDNPRIPAAIAGLIAALLTRKMIWTIGCGLVVYWAVQLAQG